MSVHLKIQPQFCKILLTFGILACNLVFRASAAHHLDDPQAQVHCIVESSRANDDTEREISRQYAQRFPLKAWSADADNHPRPSAPAAISAASPPRKPVGPCEDGCPHPDPPPSATTPPAPANLPMAAAAAWVRPPPRPWTPAELRRAYGDLPAGAARMLLRACLRCWGRGDPATAAALAAAPASPAPATAAVAASADLDAEGRARRVEGVRDGPRGAVADDEASAAPPPVGSAGN
jgi:hypothetical protein